MHNQIHKCRKQFIQSTQTTQMQEIPKHTVRSPKNKKNNFISLTCIDELLSSYRISILALFRFNLLFKSSYLKHASSNGIFFFLHFPQSQYGKQLLEVYRPSLVQTSYLNYYALTLNDAVWISYIFITFHKVS